MKYRAAILGASGAVGSSLLTHLLDSSNCETILSLGRRSIDLEKLSPNFSKCKQEIIDFENFTIPSDLLSGIDSAYCTLGIGQPSKVSKEEFWKIDVEYVSRYAKLCADAGVRYFSLLSAVDANSDSNVYYLKAKGVLQERVIHSGFKGVYIYQPSLLATDQARYGFFDSLVQFTFPLIAPILPSRYHQIHVKSLGKAMCTRAEKAITSKEVGVTEFLTYNDFLKHL
ncbi:MAG TPA: hypothetical protein PK079_23285 [Leptospiraceae bacterium]|nr:hypothetical protein [Leptospiraceae bacterium]HMX31349.1 hypothetical protein [Leptospiraceae bacterium]HMY31608.1 hypothetical protein [Leptospiraceae bacterium]HMZ66130.1 hypothetical protein [Leptospiraceae bacterium]HNC57114.1 hypothetical protein [Leptospiraceae bacterium]